MVFTFSFFGLRASLFDFCWPLAMAALLPAGTVPCLSENVRRSHSRHGRMNPSPPMAFRTRTGRALMETMELHRGRLVDHIQLVVADLAASRRFYDAVFEVLKIPLGGSAETHFWYDELFVSTPDGPE